MELKPGFKLTEIGPMPEDWDAKAVGEISTVATGSTPPTADPANYGDEFLFVSPGDLGERKEITSTEKRLSRKGFSKARRFPQHSVLFVCIGSTIGKCGVSSVELTSNQQINAIFPSSSFSSDFLFYSLVAAAPRIRALAGEQAVPLINKYQFSEALIAVPPLPEQTAIAAALSDVDTLLEALDRLIAKKRDLKQAAMQQLLTGRRRLPGFSGAWNMTRLGDHLVFLRHGVNSRAELLPDGGVKYLHYGDVHACKDVYLTPETLSSLPDCKAASLDRLQDGDLVLADASEDVAGVCKSVEIRGVHRIPVVPGLHTIAARFDKEVLADGFKGFLQFCPAFATHLRRLAAGTKVYATNRAHVASVEMRLPPVLEQSAIARVLSDMDGEIAALAARRDKTRNLKQAMMQELLTGKTRLV